MLGNVAKKMRLLGYDSKYDADIDDDKLIEEAKNEDRVIVSRDESLVRKSKKAGLKSILVSRHDEIGQFLEIINSSGIAISQINGDIARCPKCNSNTEVVLKSSVKELIPPKVFEINEKFWKCKGCNQVYWEGTHITNLQRFVMEINERLQ
ncbi:Mut7-C RNAse domain-containing protein [Nitrosopumilus sp. K4]|uniref:Mut7-C RNAse domain-containing protein n=1 Tax=Nitrosopumilus sp. K4 TaxID=2795383 RepID=UPI001BAAA101|nr:Mut7-C RNAse domain-containing protein [Nitrosopumilus sp. K4]QUC64529.1 Mut7-C RNAse domain-containing protein [Nitrosopumilus sp. K4]